jgi:hypothetical protein
VLQARADPGFPAELLPVTDAGALDRDDPAEFEVGGAPHHPHATRADGVLEPVPVSYDIPATHRSS